MVFTREERIELIRQSDIFNANLDTVGALEEVANILLGFLKIVEWYEYGGEPFFFKVLTEKTAFAPENIETFNRLASR